MVTFQDRFTWLGLVCALLLLAPAGVYMYELRRVLESLASRRAQALSTPTRVGLGLLAAIPLFPILFIGLVLVGGIPKVTVPAAIVTCVLAASAGRLNPDIGGRRSVRQGIGRMAIALCATVATPFAMLFGYKWFFK